MPAPIVIIIMGVSGSGKTTVGRRLAVELGWRFHDADDDHQPESIARMARGKPLTNEQRRPWLHVLAERIRTWCNDGTRTVLACSALTAESRATLAGRCAKDCVIFVHLHGRFDLIRDRMKDRAHFMPPSLLQTQFESLEPPADAVELDAAEEPDALVEQIRKALAM